MATTPLRTNTLTATPSSLLRTLRNRLRLPQEWRRTPAATLVRPKLAERVSLIGPMTESAFAKQPWLIERSGRFIQVTELLYRIAECADGSATVEEIAAGVSRVSGSDVSPEFVWRMLELRLIPMGIVAPDPGIPTAQAAASTSRGGQSALGLNMRMALVNPRWIDALTRFLQYLYAPVVLVPMLVIIVQAQYWLLCVHGVAGGLYESINSPGVMPFVMALVVASAAFHELGHAAALRYGGGQVRGMGVGMYLVYPAFYTDVTDNYRLGRWARVRTDLGGFYFNLLFSLGLMAVYHVTGHEFLLLVALLIDIEIVHQCLPFIRLDGYWALADLTGIPDFLSFMGAYLRSTLPVRGWKGQRLPELRWWAKVVFGVYIAVAVPLIGLLIFAMLKAAPRIVTTAAVTVQQRLADVAQAEANGDAVAAASAEFQMLLLLLPVLGLAFMLFTLGRTLLVWLWRWGRPTRARRLASAAVAATIAGVLVVLWVPGLNAQTFARTSVTPTPEEPVTVASTPEERVMVTPTSEERVLVTPTPEERMLVTPTPDERAVAAPEPSATLPSPTAQTTAAPTAVPQRPTAVPQRPTDVPQRTTSRAVPAPAQPATPVPATVPSTPTDVAEPTAPVQPSSTAPAPVQPSSTATRAPVRTPVAIAQQTALGSQTAPSPRPAGSPAASPAPATH